MVNYNNYCVEMKLHINHMNPATLDPSEKQKMYVRSKICMFIIFQMAQLPEGITELLQHEKLRVPLVRV